MRPVLFRIPLDGSLDFGPLGQWPVFGFGLLLGLWLAVGLFVWVRSRRDELSASVPGDIVTFFLIGAAIFFAPKIAMRFDPENQHPSIPIFGYGVMMCLGFVSATMLANVRAAKAGFAPETIWDLTFWFLLSGVGGARLFYLIQHGGNVFAKCETAGDYLKAAINLPDGGLVFYGGLILGAAAYGWFCHSRKLPAWKLGDILVPSVFLGIAFGRIGCFLYGCCYGDRCDLPWGVEFPKWMELGKAVAPDQFSVPFKSQWDRGFITADAATTLRIHPTQLYSAIDGSLLCLLTLAYYPVRGRDGSVITLGLLTYPITRFLIERLRGDEMGQFGTSLTIAQWISIAMFVGGIALAVSRPPVLKRTTEDTVPSQVTRSVSEGGRFTTR